MITEQDNLSPDEVTGSLRRVPVFKGLSDDELQALVETLKGIKAGPGDLLFEEGDEDDRFFVVTAGAVEIVKHVPGGGEEKLAVRRAGEVFGEMALLNDAPRFATARVAGECECMTHGIELEASRLHRRIGEYDCQREGRSECSENREGSGVEPGSRGPRFGVRYRSRRRRRPRRDVVDITAVSCSGPERLGRP